MQRKTSVSGTDSTNWSDFTGSYVGGYGTPQSVNTNAVGCTDRTEHLNNGIIVNHMMNHFYHCLDFISRGRYFFHTFIDHNYNWLLHRKSKMGSS
jgi:hypothetical protein